VLSYERSAPDDSLVGITDDTRAEVAREHRLSCTSVFEVDF
jgi:hypothetical protein